MPRLFTVLTLVIFLTILSCGSPGTTPTAAAGVLDLRNWDFQTQGSLALNGDWQFFPSKLPEQITAETPPVYEKVPGLWKDDPVHFPEGRGLATYRLKVLLPSNSPNLAVRIITASSALKLTVDGTVVAQVGRVSTDPAAVQAQYNPLVVPLMAASDSLTIDLTVANQVYRNGGLWRPLSIGKWSDQIQDKKISDFTGLSICTMILALAAGSFFIFLLRRQDLSLLLFALLALLIALRALVTGEYLLAVLFPTIPFDLLVRLEYVTAFVTLPLGLWFFSTLFPDLVRRKLLLTMTLPMVPFWLLIPLAPLGILTRSIIWFDLYAVTLIVVGFFLFIRQILRKRSSVIVSFGAIVLLAAAGINDAFYATFDFPTGNLLPPALLFFTLIQAGVLARRFIGALHTAETLSLELTVANRALENLLQEKDLLIKEVHHRVKNSLQIVSSLISLHSLRTGSEHHELVTTLKRRIAAISLVHEKLYGSFSNDQIELDAYLYDLIQLLVSGYSLPNGALRLDIRLEPMRISVDYCVDIGLIITELVSNAFKHVFLSQSGDCLSVTLKKFGEEMILGVQDNGPGLGSQFDPAQTPTLGFKMIVTLLKRCKGQLEWNQGVPGTRVEIRVPQSR